MKTRMLEGYKVLDFTQALAGPTATRYLAQMGAEVIQVELAPDGDLARAVPFGPALPRSVRRENTDQRRIAATPMTPRNPFSPW
jgi:CoA:oxalate CoA-transferase